MRDKSSIERSPILSVRGSSNVRIEKTPVLGRVIVLSIGVLSWAINLTMNNETSSALAAASSVLLSFYLLLSTRKNKGLLVVCGYLFLSVYSSCVVNYFGMDIFSPYQQWVGTSVSFKSVNVLLLFLIGITAVMPLVVKEYPTKRLIQRDTSSNGFLVAVCAVAFLMCGVFGVGSASAVSDRYGITPIYEYSMAFLIVGLYFGGSRVGSITVFALISVIRISIDFAIGSRVTSIAILAIWYLMMLAPRLKTRYLIPMLVTAFVAMLTVGELRGSSFSLSAITKGITDFFDAGFAWDGAYAAYHTSESMVAYRELQARGTDIPGLVNYLSSLVVGVSAGHVELQHEMQPFFWNMGGGYLPFFFYYYIGYAGVAIAALITGAILRFIALLGDREDVSDISTFVFVWICATSFRWLSYSASPLVRGVLLVVTLFAVLGILAKVKPVLIPRGSGVER